MSKLRGLNVSEKTEKKGRFTYLSWAYAVDVLIEHYPNATWEVKRFPLITVHDGETKAIPEMQVPFMKTNMGNFVEVEVTVEGISRSQVHPILNHQNKPIDKPNAFDVNTAIQRCLAKAIALHGLGLYIYAGEDLPPKEVAGTVDNTVMVNMEKVHTAIDYFKKMIDRDQPEETAEKIKETYNRMSNDERLEVQKGLMDKAPDCNKMYKTLLTEHLGYIQGGE